MSLETGEAEKIWSNAKVYALGSIINRAGGLILIPLYAHLLTPVEFGVYSIVVIAVEFAGVLISNSMGTAMAKTYLETDDTDRRFLTGSTTFICFFVAAGFLAVASYPLSLLVGQILFQSAEWNLVILLAVLSLIFNLLLELELNYYRLRMQPWIFMLLSAAKMILMIGITYVFLKTLDMGLLGIMWASTIAFALVSVPAIVVVLRQTGWGFDRSIFRSLVTLSLPLVPGKLSDVATQFFDRYFIGILVNVASVGHYALAQRVASLIQLLFISPFAQVWIVRRLESLSRNTDQTVFRDVFRIFLVIQFSAAVAISLFSTELVALIADQSFKDSARFVPLLCLAAVLMPIDMNLQLGILHASKTTYMMWSSIIAAVLSIPLMLIFIAEWGPSGAAASVALVNLIRIAVTGYLGWRYCDSKIDPDIVMSGILLGLAACAYLAGEALFDERPLFAAIAGKAALLVAYSTSAMVVITSQEDRRSFFISFRQKLRDAYNSLMA